MPVVQHPHAGIASACRAFVSAFTASILHGLPHRLAPLDTDVPSKLTNEEGTIRIEMS